LIPRRTLVLELIFTIAPDSIVLGHKETYVTRSETHIPEAFMDAHTAKSATNSSHEREHGSASSDARGAATAEPYEPLASTAQVVSEFAVHRLEARSECSVSFNVMPNRPVREELRIHEYRIGPNWIEAQFDRTYYTSMVNSPTHLTFVAALVQMQKITYVYACRRFGFSSDLRDTEALKIWPTDVQVSMRDLVRDETQLVHRMEFTTFRKLAHRKYLAVATSSIGALRIDGSAMIILLSEPCLNS
jgi:hypothetical protein